MYNIKTFLGGLCLASSVYANNWITSPVRIEFDPKVDEVNTVAVYEAASPALEGFPVFQSAKGDGIVVASAEPPQLNEKTGRYTRSYNIKVPADVVAGERHVVLPYRVAGEDESRELTLIVRTPEATLLSSRRLVWGREASPDAKKVTVTLITPEGFELKEAETVRGDAAAKIEREAPHRYTIIVTPADTSKPGRSIIKVKALGQFGQEAAFVIYAEVR